MSQTRLTYLLQRHFEDNISVEELDELVLHIENGNSDGEIKNVMSEFWENYQGTTSVFPTEKSESMLAGILKVNELNDSYPIRKNRKWLYAAAATVIVLLGSAAFYQFALNKTKNQNIAKTDGVSADRAPGVFKAVLTLADKQAIVLDSTENNSVAQQGTIKIVKPENGQLIYIPSDKKSDQALVNIVTTPRGGHYQLTLSDGSKVWLNAASSIRFPVAFEGIQRKVEITGEAYFEVAKNASMPFIVSVEGKTEVTVLGTHFNINAYGDETLAQTSLLEGSVKITSNISHSSKIISPGQQVQLNANGQLQLNKDADMDAVMAWKNELFNFSNADLTTILKQLSRWYDVEIVFEGPVPQRKFEGEIHRNLNLSQVLSVLEKNNLHFKIENNKLIVLK